MKTDCPKALGPKERILCLNKDRGCYKSFLRKDNMMKHLRKCHFKFDIGGNGLSL